MSMRLNVTADETTRKDLLELIRNQIRPLVQEVIQGPEFQTAIKDSLDKAFGGSRIQDIVNYEIWRNYQRVILGVVHKVLESKIGEAVQTVVEEGKQAREKKVAAIVTEVEGPALERMAVAVSKILVQRLK